MQLGKCLEKRNDEGREKSKQWLTCSVALDERIRIGHPRDNRARIDNVCLFCPGSIADGLVGNIVVDRSHLTSYRRSIFASSFQRLDLSRRHQRRTDNR